MSSEDVFRRLFDSMHFHRTGMTIDYVKIKANPSSINNVSHGRSEFLGKAVWLPKGSAKESSAAFT